MGIFDRWMGAPRWRSGPGGPKPISTATYLMGVLGAILVMFALRVSGLLGDPSAAAQETNNAPTSAEAPATAAPMSAEAPATAAPATAAPAATAPAATAAPAASAAPMSAAAPTSAAAEGHGEGHGEGHPAGDHGDGHGDGGGHADPIAPILILLTVILLAAKVGGDVFERFKQPSVLGELVFGVLLGNVLYFVPEMPGHELFTIIREGTAPFQVADLIGGGMPVEEAVKAKFSGDYVPIFTEIFSSAHGFTTVSVARTLDNFSRMGVIILLFMVGLETNFRDMVKVGVTSFVVAVIGVVVPFALGFGVSYFALPEESVYVHLFIGATLCATSVGITARVFKDLKKLHTTEAKIILGAAVIDDVLGLVILAVVAGIITTVASGAELSGADIAITTGIISFKAFAFLAVSLFVGLKFTPFITGMVAKMRVAGMKLTYALMFAFVMSYLANVIGLAPIVGAFAAGLILDDVHFKDFKDDHGHGHGHTTTVEELVAPIAGFLVPVFFVQMGIQVKLETFADISVLGVAGGLTLAAIIGKQVCGLVVREKGISKISVGAGMIPRGEVGLIFAAIGKELPPIGGHKIIDDATFSAVVIMVIVTTLVTPPLLKFFLDRHYAGKDAAAEG